MLSKDKHRSSSRAKKKVFIVEDEPALLALLVRKFEQAGFSVSSALDGVQGLRGILHDRPDFILLDIVMPHMDGITMLKELRKRRAFSTVPVIVLTNLIDSRAVTEALGHGAYDYLVKTEFDVSQIIAKVKQKLYLK